MAKDMIYYFDKTTRIRHTLGEVQKGFNMSFVIDGTKDSAKAEVISFNELEIEPNTIVYHNETNTWWIVAHDKVERYYHEIDNVYKHNLQLLGAIELLNARDLTDCGFNSKTYTLEQFIRRLFSLSNFELPLNVISPIKNSIDTSIVVDYIKTFENYTLLSALREILDGYNCCPKLTFRTQTTGGNTRITQAVLTIYSKVGKGIIDWQESDFSNVKETKTMDKNSFGTIVVSNAENVVSTKAKTYPSVGYVKLSSNEYDIDRDKAILRLPSNINKVNWLEMTRPVYLYLSYTYSGTTDSFPVLFEFCDFNVIKEKYIEGVNNWKYGSTLQTDVPQEMKDYFISQADFVSNQIIKAMTTRFWYNDNYDPVGMKYMPRTDIQDFYFPKLYVRNGNTVEYFGEVVITNEELGKSTKYVQSSIMFKRGNNVITNFICLGNNSSHIGKFTLLENYDSTDLGEANKVVLNYDITMPGGGTVNGNAHFVDTTNIVSKPLTTRNTYWRVNYVPMSDLKIKYDNSGDSNDIQLYNQVGRLTDGVALSKLMLSYSKEIESDTITKYLNGYDFGTLPKVGDGVSIGTNAYIINNISYDFYENESGDTEFDYYIVGEYTMSKWTSTKSLLTNPNTNIRDYGIPQNNNVARKQLYRDFYELNKSVDTEADTDYYMPFNKIFNLTNYYKGLNEHVAVIKLEYENAYGGGGTYYDDDPVEPSDTWYYQLDTTTYVLKKAVYEVIDFNDNNIIGYCSQNVNSAFDIRRIFTGMIDNINTPISYVDENGNVKSFYIAMCNINQLTTIYDYYLKKMEQTYQEVFNGTLYNYSIFIPSDIYNGFYDLEQTYTSDNFTVYESGEETQILGVTYTAYSINLKGIGALPQDYDRETTDITLHMGDVYEGETLITPQNPTITKNGDNYYLFFTVNGTHGELEISFYLTYQYIAFINGAKDSNDFQIVEEDYNKDALEVPVFEYSCQIDDTEEVVVGENILETQSGDKYAYSYYLVNKNTINENTFNSIELEKIHIDNDIVTNEEIAFWDKAVVFEYDSSEIKILLYGQCDKLNLENEATPSYSSRVTLTSSMFADKDLVIARHKIPEKYTNEFVDPFYNLNTTNELLFVVKGITSTNIVDNKIVLKINHYNIK